MLPDQAFIYLLITFAVIFFFHQLTEWKKTGSPSASLLSANDIKWAGVYTCLLWITSGGLAILYWEGLENSWLHIASYLGATLLATIALMLRMVVKTSEVNV